MTYRFEQTGCSLSDIVGRASTAVGAVGEMLAARGVTSRVSIGIVSCGDALFDEPAVALLDFVFIVVSVISR